jgi:hypothetical protein
MTHCHDMKPWLEEALAEMDRNGFGAEAEQIRAAVKTFSTSSLEITGEIGMAILRVQANVGHLLPRPARRNLKRCLREIRRAWPGLGQE